MMRKNISLAGLLCAVFFLFFSCTGTKTNNSEEQDSEKLMELNKAMVNAEQEAINSYIQRYGYTMQETKTGLHIMHVKEGKGLHPGMKSDVTIAYKVTLLDGSYCYSSDSSGALTFRLGESDEPGGLQEGLLQMKEGGKALMIIPSWLGYGLTGDGNKIGNNQSLVYSVELLKVN
jgi:FKBP-type peptidyl-prolyl cis-trans isomerase FkpA